jgi:hypothetical protein
MSRIRTIKPKFFQNEDLAALPYEWRLLFIGLWTQADREGRLEDRPRRLKAALFPYDDLDVNAGLGCLTNAGFLTRYEVNGVRYLAIPTWLKHQQPHVKEVPSDLPAPEQRSDQKTGASTVLARQEGKGIDQGREGNGTSALRARFEQLWQVYPRKVGKDAAWAVWQKQKPDEALTAAMVSAVQEQAQSAQWRRDGGIYIPHPRTWLNQGRWQDSAVIEVDPSGPLDGLKEFVRG